MKSNFDVKILGNTLLEYLIALGILAGGWLVLWGIRKIALSRLKGKEDETSKLLVKGVNKLLYPFALFGIFYLAFKTLEFGEAINKIVMITGYVLLALFGVNVLINAVVHILERKWIKEEEDELRIKSYHGLIFLIKFLLWSIALIFILDNLGFNITTVITGLGIGGIAIALGAQAVLGDLFSYFSILFDKPFRVNDFLIINEFLGTVEHIGIKTTRLRSLSGEELVFSNSDITSSRLKNYGRMEERRINFQFGITYNTSYEKLEAIPRIVQEIVDGVEEARFERSHFSSFSAYSLIIETIYYVLIPEYQIYMDVQQEINLKLKKALEEEGIQFAFPTQTIYSHHIE